MSNTNIISPLGVALWLIHNTSLTFDQIANFCSLYLAEVEALADGTFINLNIPTDPIKLCILTREEIQKCEADKTRNLQRFDLKLPIKPKKLKKYTSRSQRKDRPECILWLHTVLKTTHDVTLTDAQIIKLLRTTKNMVSAIREKSYPKYSSLTAKDPVIVGFCTQKELNFEIEKAKKAQEKENTAE
jgi:hypothetical protein